eukprot:364027-Chlamydomonas_euryale.AAC.11
MQQPMTQRITFCQKAMSMPESLFSLAAAAMSSEPGTLAGQRVDPHCGRKRRGAPLRPARSLDRCAKAQQQRLAPRTPNQLQPHRPPGICQPHRHADRRQANEVCERRKAHDLARKRQVARAAGRSSARHVGRAARRRRRRERMHGRQRVPHVRRAACADALRSDVVGARPVAHDAQRQPHVAVELCARLRVVPVGLPKQAFTHIDC